VGQHAGFTVARADGHRRAELAEQAPGVGDDQVSTGSQDTDELRQGGAEVRHMGERQGAHNDIDSVIGDRQLMQVSPRRTGVRHVGDSSVEHRLRAVDADDTVAQLGEVLGMPSGAARDVERKADGQVLEDLADNGLPRDRRAGSRAGRTSRPTSGTRRAWSPRRGSRRHPRRPPPPRALELRRSSPG
jgi:hypothetical protein